MEIFTCHDLKARPVYHHKRDSIEAHLTIMFADLAVSRWIEQATGWSIRKFIRTAALPHHRDSGRPSHHHRRRSLSHDSATTSTSCA
jgi:hypothetical protein